jgi:hypothetical protein
LLNFARTRLHAQVPIKSMTPLEIENHHQITLDRLVWIVDQVKAMKFDADSQSLVIQLSENATRLHTIADALNGMADDLS